MASLSKTSMDIAKEAEISKELLKFMLTGVNHSCQGYHFGGTCNDRMRLKTLKVMKGLTRINIPIHIIPALLFKLKQITQNPAGFSVKLVINILRSVMFLTSFVMSIHMIQCYGARMFPQIPMKLLHVITVLVSCFGIAFE